MSVPRFGDFEFQAVVDAYEPKLVDLHPSELRHGLSLQVQYFYGGLRDADGATWAVERKFCGPMTGGLWLMNDSSGDLNLHPGAFDSARGESLRTIEPSRRRWTNHLMHAMAERFGVAGQPLDLAIDDDGITWAEGDLLSIAGPLQGPGFQFCMPARTEPLFYTTQVYWVTGTIAGKPAEGFVGLDHGYFQPGVEWKEYRYFKDLEISWEVFGNKFTDGAVDYGVIVKGRQGWSGAATFDAGKLVAKTDRLGATYRLDGEGFIEQARFDIDGQGYTFTGSERGKMRHFGEARWAGYTSQAGITRRDGDPRALDVGFTWIEFFPGRIKSDHLVAG
ncbi:hypothetical protein A4G26_19440 [Mycobacterium kansasii]|uniref:AttH domain-containing protein n=2 Tax=Mycobacterium innocens TaxID=2341083 RepID=A0A498QNS1_9MYCO|nr:hypothetical protein A4G26_19440 [Mycobacterium kansasii]VBA45919.1 hypothetical protein LAUMK13_05559 [Mycobacterium innocens]